MFFQEMCEATSMLEEREKGRKTMQITLLFDSKSDAFHNKNTAFSVLKHPTKSLYLSRIT